jgi:hypothetical protein
VVQHSRPLCAHSPSGAQQAVACVLHAVFMCGAFALLSPSCQPATSGSCWFAGIPSLWQQQFCCLHVANTNAGSCPELNMVCGLLRLIQWCALDASPTAPAVVVLCCAQYVLCKCSSQLLTPKAICVQHNTLGVCMYPVCPLLCVCSVLSGAVYCLLWKGQVLSVVPDSAEHNP